jgi:pyruvate dehydrogenase E2 component (dihydrolipoamide acetyltransferase)
MDFVVPKLSATMESARVLRWLKQVGDKVAIGEPLVELETDKAAMEVESPVDATLDAVVADEGAELPIGAVLARLEIVGVSAAAEKPRGATIAAASARTAGPPVIPSDGSSAPTPLPRILASPLARRLAQMNGVDLAGLAGGQRIRKRDVLAAIEERAAEEVRAAPTAAGFAPFSAMRSQIAEAVALSRRTIPSFVLDRWVETTGIDRARSVLNFEIEQATGIRPTLTDFLLQAVAYSLAAHRHILDRWQEEDGRAGRIRGSCVDIGLVVAVADGVIIPVLRDLAGKPLPEITRARHDAVQRARSGRLRQADSVPVAFSLSNVGDSGADRFEAIINPGQSSILAVGRRHERVIARAGAIAIATGVNLTFSVDHRLIDGLHGAQFLKTLAERIELGLWRAT